MFWPMIGMCVLAVAQGEVRFQFRLLTLFLFIDKSRSKSCPIDLPQVDSNQGVKKHLKNDREKLEAPELNSKCHIRGSEYSCQSNISFFLLLFNTLNTL